MRIPIATLVSLLVVTSCKSAPDAGPLGEGLGGASRIVAADTARPLRSVAVQLEEPAYAAVLLVQPGYTATLVYPKDSAMNNQLPAGPSTVPLFLPQQVVRRDSGSALQREGMRRAQDSAIVRRGTAAGARATTAGPAAAAETFLLLLTSPQPLVYQRIIDRTGGVTIPNIQDEALHAVAKAVRATLPEPRRLAGYFQLIQLARPR